MIVSARLAKELTGGTDPIISPPASSASPQLPLSPPPTPHTCHDSCHFLKQLRVLKWPGSREGAREAVPTLWWPHSMAEALKHEEEAEGTMGLGSVLFPLPGNL